MSICQVDRCLALNLSLCSTANDLDNLLLHFIPKSAQAHRKFKP